MPLNTAIIYRLLLHILHLKCECYLLCELSKGILELGEHAVKGHQQHLTRRHLWRVLGWSIHASRLDQLRVLSTQHTEKKCFSFIRHALAFKHLQVRNHLSQCSV